MLRAYLTIQGEGRHAGRLASFLRLSGCNLSCAWCDTPYTWDWQRYNRGEETHPFEPEEVASTLDGLDGRVVVSGGEPLLQAKGLAALLSSRPVWEWDVETNGTRPLGPTAGLWTTVTASPKVIPSAGQDQRFTRVHPEVAEVADFKFVVRDEADLRAVKRWLVHEGLKVPVERVWLMPEGTDAATLTDRTPWLMERATALGVNFTTRLHVYGWGDERGH